MRYGMLIAAVLLALAPVDAWAKRTITGTVTLMDEANSPAVDVMVAAYDEDDVTGGSHELLGVARTDAQGRYTINYGGGPYDTRVPGSTSFRPDIFLAVYVVESWGPMKNMRLGAAAGRPYDADASRLDPDRVRVFMVKKTTTKENWKMSEDMHRDISLPGIRGKVEYESGAPAGGLLIRAIDDDINTNDVLSATTTSADGRYFMFLPGGHCDWTPPNPIGFLASVGVAVATGGTAFPVAEVVNAITNSSWKSAMHRVWTSWRCDVYVRVLTADGDRLKKSRVYKNQPHRETLTINFVVPNPEYDLAWLVVLQN